jgi:choline-sulfatase
LKSQGYRVDSIGKLHFRSGADDNGFTMEHDPLHVVAGVGDLMSCLRDDPPIRDKMPGLREAGPGRSSYLDYDARIARQAREWLAEHRADPHPWVLFVSFVCPHPPYIAPPELFERYAGADLPLPPQWRPGEQPNHPALRWMRERFRLGDWDEALVRRVAAAYYGATTYLDERIGEVLSELEHQGLGENTRILYTSDHGECLGARGLFGKFTMYEESAAVPMIAAGPEVPAGHVVGTPVSLVDCAPSVVECVGAEPDEALPGRSLWELARAPDPDLDRCVLSEYHAVNARRGVFMARSRRFKYVRYVEAPAQLFDLAHDPQELRDLAGEPDARGVVDEMEARLRELLGGRTPEEVDARARRDQAQRVAEHGGEELVRRRGTFDNSPIPGEAAQFRDRAT